MDLALFFKREGAASALVGTLLKETPEFRAQFFEAFDEDLEPGLVASLREKAWDVDVEVEQIDIRLTARDGSTLLTIENKLRAGSVQHGQLAKYYERAVSCTPEKRIGLVYLAPGPSMGEREVERVRKAIRQQRRKDFAVRVSWDALQDAAQKLYDHSEAGAWQSRFVAEGFVLIKKVIDEAPSEVWKPVGGRGRVRDMAMELRRHLLRAFPEFQLGNPWPSKDGYVLATRKTDVTMWLSLRFKPRPDPPYEPDNWETEGGVRLKLVGALKLSAVGRRQPELRERWELMTNAGTLAVPGFDLLTKRESGWMVAEQELIGAPEEIVQGACRAGAALLEVIKRFA